VRGLASEIEKLAPAVDRQKWYANAEYPWRNRATLTVPSTLEEARSERSQRPRARSLWDTDLKQGFSAFVARRTNRIPEAFENEAWIRLFACD